MLRDRGKSKERANKRDKMPGGKKKVQAHLGDISGLVPDHHDKAGQMNVSVSQCI